MENEDKTRLQNRQRQEKRQGNLKRRYGKAFSLNLNEATMERLLKIIPQTIVRKNEESITVKRSLAVTELINRYFLENTVPRHSEVSVTTYELYCKVRNMRISGKISQKIAEELNNAGHLIPVFDNETGRISLEEGTWNSRDILTISDTNKIIQMIDSNERYQ
ncbi:TPA: hypothetical protein ACYRTT_003231 [Escherichia coli]|uniref:hypothetical protein n=1 Tax=Enterobacterales TaxID=91347 RepID=UPI000BE322AE|nr:MULTISPECIES: hypothetical protein [Enterobacterales]EDU9586702.1 hypothetical protein [Salmonella enterica subsp. enterica serovar Kisangani]ELT5304532.1 hypothetical protein [Enterobacter roggenkampii]HCC5836647.1 hypothetical protein [Citrobacter farmeri]EFC1956376.1 hypothetical protein [Escherichia coli]EFJ3219318.1 hypothetical protein [Escherichia coli]